MAQKLLSVPLILEHFKIITNSDTNEAWKSQELSDEIIKSLVGSNNNLAPPLIYINTKM